MFVWCGMLFLLGIAAFLDTIFNYGNIFRQINSAMFMLISLGLLVRTTVKMKARKLEMSEQKVANLEMKLQNMETLEEVNPSDY